MDDSTLAALRLVQGGRTADMARAVVSRLQSAGLVQRLNGELCLTQRGAAVLNGAASGTLDD